MSDMTIHTSDRGCDIPICDDIGNSIIVSISTDGLSDEQRSAISVLEGLPSDALMVERAYRENQKRIRYIPYFYCALVLAFIITKLALAVIS